MYTYRAKIISVYDGDTVTALVDLGFGITNKIKIRLKGINTPELRGAERPRGLVSRDFLREKILDKDIIVETFRDKKGKYGRYIGTLWLDEENINELLVEQGYAETREY
jgi:micrococcal nuclease